MAKRGVTCKVYKSGKSFVMSLPLQLVKALQIKPGEKLLITIDNENNIIVQSYKGELLPKSKVVKARVIGGARLKDDFFRQFGFTIPAELADHVKDIEYSFPVIEEKKDDYFKIVFKANSGVP